ncbi:MAG: AarF/ABC1/UbiB kinase family protein [Pseudomonadota bacterium]
MRSVTYSLFRVGTTRRRFRRMRQVLAVLIRHGFGDVAERIGVARAWRRASRAVAFRRAKAEAATLSMGERLRRVFEELGPAYIKLGQVLANRPDLLPMEVVNELAKLQDAVPPFSYEEAEAVLVEELGGPVELIFASLEREPLAAASIAQVHRGVLKTGEAVAVKVCRPGIRRSIDEDLDLLRAVATHFHATIPEWSRFNLPGFIEEFGRSLRSEMDFVNEVSNIERFRRNFEDDPHITAPRVHREYCTASVIVMEFIDGWKVTDNAAWEAQGISAKELAEIGTSIMLRSVFEHRFFHADPHPGNLFVLPGPQICMVDFGMMGAVDDRRMDEMLTFMVGVLSGDADLITELFVDSDLVPEETDLRAMKRDLSMLMDRFLNLSLEEVDVQGLIETVMAAVIRHKVTPPPDLLLIGRALSTMEGIATRIYPEYKPLESVRPYLTALFLKRMMDPTQRVQQAYDVVSEYGSFLRVLPGDLKSLLRRLRKGQLELRIDLMGEDGRSRRRDRAANRMILTAISVTAFLSATLLLSFDTGCPPHLPILALGTAVGTFGWVVLGILRSGGT